MGAKKSFSVYGKTKARRRHRLLTETRRRDLSGGRVRRGGFFLSLEEGYREKVRKENNNGLCRKQIPPLTATIEESPVQVVKRGTSTSSQFLGYAKKPAVIDEKRAYEGPSRNHGREKRRS